MVELKQLGASAEAPRVPGARKPAVTTGFNEFMGRAREGERHQPERQRPADKETVGASDAAGAERQEAASEPATDEPASRPEVHEGVEVAADANADAGEEHQVDEQAVAVAVQYVPFIPGAVTTPDGAATAREIDDGINLEVEGQAGESVWARWLRAVEGSQSSAAVADDSAESSLPQPAAAQQAPAQTDALNLLSFDELMDPNLVLDPSPPDQILQRIQQAATSPQAAALSGGPVEEAVEIVMPQVVRGLATLVRDGLSEMRIALDPPDLGEIEMRVRTMDGAVRTQLMVQQPEVKHLLEQQLNRLREALEEQGLELAGLDVDLARDQSSDNEETQERGTGRFRGPVGATEVGTDAQTVATSIGPPSDGEVDYVA